MIQANKKIDAEVMRAFGREKSRLRLLHFLCEFFFNFSEQLFWQAKMANRGLDMLSSIWAGSVDLTGYLTDQLIDSNLSSVLGSRIPEDEFCFKRPRQMGQKNVFPFFGVS